MSEWKTIDTAPRDGRDYLVFCRKSGEQFVAYWRADYSCWAYALTEDGPISVEATNWQPLPPPPAENQQ